MNVIIGVDSGGTRTSVKIIAGDPPGLVLQYEALATLDGSLSPKQYGETLRKVLARAAAQVLELPGCSVHLFISAAGFSPPVRHEFLTALRNVMPDLLGDSVAAAGAANDGVSLMLAYESSLAVIAGTGSIVLVRSPEGFRQVGGHDWVACDQGSGFWIGLRSIRRAFNDLDQGVDSVLLQRLYEHFGLPLDDDERLVAKAYDLAVAHASMKREIARFAASVCGAAERGDLVAQDIVKAEAEELADLTISAVRRFPPPGVTADLTGVLCGGLLSNEFYRKAFDNQVAMRLSSTSPLTAISWRQVNNGLDAAVVLATKLANSDLEFMSIDEDHRPVVVHF
ncbi:MAG: BadF/BadG/BcrA/BcrD ATPase family protein [Ilumatobacteraceae bacterium]